MKKLLDLRFVIGMFFTIIGALLAIYHFTGTVNVALNTSVNIWCGVLFMLFGTGMIVLSYARRNIDDE